MTSKEATKQLSSWLQLRAPDRTRRDRTEEEWKHKVPQICMACASNAPPIAVQYCHGETELRIVTMRRNAIWGDALTDS
ncbi:hypothetical protein E5D57_010206 [Metarhizium anisopliae]|nr:hypothetical protein E5D57_010206 [Metarhizium anisopliae]